MKYFVLVTLLAAALAAPTLAAPRTLKAFTNEAELQDAFKTLRESQRRELEKVKSAIGAAGDTVSPMSAPPVLVSPSAPPPAAAKAAAEPGKQESITNVQTQGVDEGGIVKNWGEYLVVLRRGRLFTVKVGASTLALASVSATNAYGPGIDGRGAWYDEMLIHGNTIVVIGFSYTRNGTEIGLFQISNDGALKHQSTHHLRSNDYFSSRNYASRLVGSKLIFYSPLYMNIGHANLDTQLPGLKGDGAKHFKRIAPAERIYRLNKTLEANQALHTVTTCDVAAKPFSCESTSVIAPWGGTFYVSNNFVYIWAAYGRDALNWNGNWNFGRDAYLFRMPLDGTAPSMIHVRGTPFDQLSFFEAQDSTLHVLLQERVDAVYPPHGEQNRTLSLLRITSDSFGDETFSSKDDAYTALPPLPNGALQNRYVGEYLIYGLSHTRSRNNVSITPSIAALRYTNPNKQWELPLSHFPERIEALGKDALIAGRDTNRKGVLTMTTVQLDTAPIINSRFTMANAMQAESRTHGFFYKPSGADEGTIGLPILRGDAAASVLYVENSALTLKALGTLNSQATSKQNDNCVASCVDWYGNARPIFLGGRVFALVGYEIVEGRIADRAITETRRVNFSPSAAMQMSRWQTPCGSARISKKTYSISQSRRLLAIVILSDAKDRVVDRDTL